MVTKEEIQAYEYLGQKIARKEPELSRYALNKHAIKLAVLDWISQLQNHMTILDMLRSLNERIGTAAAINDLDNVSQMALRLGPRQVNMIDAKKDEIRFTDLIVRIMNDPRPSYITGNVKTGKTDFSLLLAEKSFELGLRERLITNIDVSTSKQNPYRARIRKVYKASEMLEQLKTRGKKIVILDEAGLHANIRRSTSRKNMFFVYFTRVCRKYKAKLIYISQDERDLDNLVQPLITSHIHKFSLKSAKVIFYTEAGEETVWLENIPPTTMKFDELSTAPFDLDIDPEEIYRAKQHRRARSSKQETQENEGEEE